MKTAQKHIIKVFDMAKNTLSDADMAEYEKLKSQKEKQLARQNSYNKNNYDRLGVVVKKGEKDRITTHYKNKGFSSFNEYICNLIYTDMGETHD